MEEPNIPRIPYTTRDATEGDLAALTGLKTPHALHADRIRHAREDDLRYLVVVAGESVIGFGSVVLGWPDEYPPQDHPGRLPVMIDLMVSPDHRSRGAGTALVGGMEEIAAGRGCREIFVSVNPADNPRAQALYVQLGYEAVDPEPYCSRWEFTDSAGNHHAGEEWVIDLAKRLN